MTYDIKKITGSGIHIVFGGTNEDRAALAQQICSSYPAYRTVLSKQFFSKKLGPLTIKQKKTMWQILSGDKALKSKGKDYLTQQMKALNCYDLRDRRPHTLSWGQKERFQLIPDMERGRRQYLFDDSAIRDKESYFPQICWFTRNKTFAKDAGSVIWLTGFSEDAFMEFPLEDREEIFGDWKLFRLKDGMLTEVINPVRQQKLQQERAERANQVRQQKLQQEQERAELERQIAVLERQTLPKGNTPKARLQRMIQQLANGEVEADRLEELFALLREVGDPEYCSQVMEIMKMDMLVQEEESQFIWALKVCADLRNELAAKRQAPKTAAELAEEKREAAAKKARQVLAMLEVKPISKREFDSYRPFFEDARDPQLWQRLAEKLERRSEEDAAFFEAYVHCTVRAEELKKEDRGTKAELQVLNVVELPGSSVLMAAMLLEGQLEAGDTLVSEETGRAHQVTGALILNEGDDPHDHVMTIRAGEVNTFRCYLTEASRHHLTKGEILVKR